MREKLEREEAKRATRDIQNKRKSVGSRHGGYHHRLNMIMMSFFFTNFLNHVKMVNLWKLFAKYGKLGGFRTKKTRQMKEKVWGCEVQGGERCKST
jgi:hypothetical protein